MARGLWYSPGLIYDGVLEPLLHGLRKKVRDIIIKGGLYPVLDLCCGPGGQVRRLLRRGRVSCGLDINLGMLKYAARRRKGIPFVCADASRTPFPTAVFKCVVVSFALHEKPEETRPRLLAEAKRLLEPGGRIILVDFERPWDNSSRLASLFVSLIERLAGRVHFRNGRDFLAKGGLRALAAENGLRELERHDVRAGTCSIVVAVPCQASAAG